MEASVEGEFEDVSVEAEHLIDAGEYVVAPIRFTGRGRRSSAPVELRMTLVCSVREGLIVHIQNYPTRTVALEAAGLSE